MKNRNFDFIEKADTKNLFSVLLHVRAEIIWFVLWYFESGLGWGFIAELED